MIPPRAPPSAEALAEGVLQGDRAALARAITLCESLRDDHQAVSAEVLTRILPVTGKAHRIGITGVPGAGKSTFIESFGTRLCERGHRVAVLAVDPSSERTGGSILGDKTRMERLSNDPRAYVRPSPSRGTLGGLAQATREALLLCEAAGYDVVLVETVGVGQSEAAVARVVDAVLLLLLAGAGDELQGIKRGLMELADVLVVHKADGDNVIAAEKAATTTRSALHFLHGHRAAPPVLTASSLTGQGIDAVWEALEAHRLAQVADGEQDRRRAAQRVAWWRALVEDRALRSVRHHPAVAALWPRLEEQVHAGEVSAPEAARAVITAWES